MLTAAIAAPKISFDTGAMIPSLPMLSAQMIGLYCRKLHHAFLSMMQNCTACEADRSEHREVADAAAPKYYSRKPHSDD